MPERAQKIVDKCNSLLKTRSLSIGGQQFFIKKKMETKSMIDKNVSKDFGKFLLKIYQEEKNVQMKLGDFREHPKHLGYFSVNVKVGEKHLGFLLIDKKDNIRIFALYPKTVSENDRPSLGHFDIIE